jgi:hypothetical protein
LPSPTGRVRVRLLGHRKRVSDDALELLVLRAGRDRVQGRGEVPADRGLPGNLLLLEQAVRQFGSSRRRLLAGDLPNVGEREPPGLLELSFERLLLRLG